MSIKRCVGGFGNRQNVKLASFCDRGRLSLDPPENRMDFFFPSSGLLSGEGDRTQVSRLHVLIPGVGPAIPVNSHGAIRVHSQDGDWRPP